MNTYSVSAEDEKHFLSQRVAILGYGSQGRAQALNLRDSGADVIVGNRAGKSFDRAAEDGFAVYPVCEAVQKADVLALLFPDESAADIYAAEIAPYLHEGKRSLQSIEPSSFTLLGWFSLPTIDQYSSLLPPVGVWTVSQFQCGGPSSQNP